MIKVRVRDERGHTLDSVSLQIVDEMINIRISE